MVSYARKVRWVKGCPYIEPSGDDIRRVLGGSSGGYIMGMGLGRLERYVAIIGRENLMNTSNMNLALNRRSYLPDRQERMQRFSIEKGRIYIPYQLEDLVGRDGIYFRNGDFLEVWDGPTHEAYMRAFLREEKDKEIPEGLGWL